ncbi:methyl-accepting chemotaxis protein [Paenibacillus harenae]|uniref:methyl-accepting chemotaxis protein n=1 Tax=Paenibacillus harenae TaxID=306543 RepID=UPI0003F5E11E|nr:methyl-accepting chemotaxis protein [Paenibacillus harenae]
MKLTISRKLFAGFMSVLLVLIAMVAMSYTQIAKVERSFTGLIEDEANHLILIQQLNVSVKKEQAGLRGYLLLGDKAALQSFTDAHSEFQKLSLSLEELMLDPEAKALHQELDQLESEYYHVSNKSIKLYVQNKTTEAAELIATDGQEIIGKFDDKAEQFTALQQGILDKGKKETALGVQSVKMLILGLGIAAVLISIVISWFIGRLISRPVVAIAKAAEQIASGDLTSKEVNVTNKDEIGDLAASFNRMSQNLRQLIDHVGSNAVQVAASAEQLTATSAQASLASEQITTTMQEVAAGATNQNLQLEEASRTMNEMSAGIQQIAVHANGVSATSIAAYETAGEGGRAIHTASEQMKSIHDTVAELAGVIQGLDRRSAEIGSILNVIAGIASQTNILSLNAAIEAVRAGEHGRGFAVVAGEVRKLAEQSTVSARQISLLIEDIQEETKRAVQSMVATTHEVASGMSAVRTAGESFAHIQGSVNTVNDQIQEVSSSIQQMASGAEQIVHAMQFITGVSETTVSGAQEVSASTEEQLASMEEVSASARSLSQLAEQLQTQIEKFKV